MEKEAVGDDGPDLDDLDVDESDGRPFELLRVGRRLEEAELVGRTGGGGLGAWASGRAAPASTRTLEGLSIYFSIRRSLLYLACRRRMLAVPSWRFLSAMWGQRDR